MRRILAPYLATPSEIVERMLELAEVGPDDILYDLGCGDGRFCIAAARRFGAQAVGIDIEPYWIEQSEANACAAGVETLTRFRVEDACDCDFGEATVICLYLVHSSMQFMAQEIARKGRPGTRVVSHSFPIDGWEPAIAETVLDANGDSHRIFLWHVGAGAKAAENSV